MDVFYVVDSTLTLLVSEGFNVEKGRWVKSRDTNNIIAEVVLIVNLALIFF